MSDKIVVDEGVEARARAAEARVKELEEILGDLLGCAPYTDEWHEIRDKAMALFCGGDRWPR